MGIGYRKGGRLYGNLEHIRPELRQTAAEMRNAYARAQKAWDEGDGYMAQVRTLALRLRSQGVSTYRIAKLLGVSVSMGQKITKALVNTGRPKGR